MTQYFKFNVLCFLSCLGIFNIQSSNSHKPLTLFNCSTVYEAKQLIKDGHDVNERNHHGNTPLMFFRRDPEIVQCLLENGADPKAVCKNGYTPLYTQFHPEAIRLLLIYGADPNVTAGDYKHTPLHDHRNPEIIKALLEYGANVHACHPANKHQTPLHTQPNEESVTLLIKYGADLHAQDLYGNTPLHTQENSDIIKILITHGADPNAKNYDNRTPLMGYNAIVEGAAEIILAGASPTDANNAYFSDWTVVKEAIDYVKNLKPETTRFFYYPPFAPSPFFFIIAKMIYEDYNSSKNPKLLIHALKANARFEELFQPEFVQQVQKNQSTMKRKRSTSPSTE